MCMFFAQKLNFVEPFTFFFFFPCEKHFIFGCNIRSLHTMEMLPALKNKQGCYFHMTGPEDNRGKHECAAAQRQVI